MQLFQNIILRSPVFGISETMYYLFFTLFKLPLYTIYLNNAEVRALDECAKNTIKIKSNQCKFVSIYPIYAHIFFRKL